MDPRRPPEHILELTIDRTHASDAIKGILHTIFYHRFFPPLYPANHDILSLTLPLVTDPTITHLIDTRTTTLVRTLPPTSPISRQPTRTTLVLQFLEKKRRKTGWFASKADEHTIWENWVVELTILPDPLSNSPTRQNNRLQSRKNARIVERSLADAVLRVVLVANRERDHIPPITTNEDNPFPCQILVNPIEGEKGEGWSANAKGGIF